MNDVIEKLRDGTEAELGALLQRINREQSSRVVNAIEQYGSVSAIPALFWQQLEREIDEPAAALILLLLVSGYETETRRLQRRKGLSGDQRQAIASLRDQSALQDAAAGSAAELGRRVAQDYTGAVRRRLGRQIDLPEPPPKNRIGEIVRDIFDDDQSEIVVATNTTRTMTTAQRSAAEDVGAATGLRVVAIWQDFRDRRVCRYCRGLHGKTIGEWEQIMRRGLYPADIMRSVLENLGPPAHPRCRCRRRHVLLTELN